MRKICMLMLLVITATQAQTITEKDLLGKWQVTGVDVYGIKSDLKTNTVTVDEAVARAKGMTSEQIEKIKAVVPGMGKQLSSNIMIFKPGMLFESIQPDKSGKGTYTLKEEDGIQYMTLVREPDVFVVSLHNGVFNMASASSPYIIMCLTKIE